MVIVSKGLVEHVDGIKSAFATNGLIMGTPPTNFSMSEVNLNNVTINVDDNLSSSTSASSLKSSSSVTAVAPIVDPLTSKLSAKCVLLCHPNSHPFQTRTLFLRPDVIIKVGRSIAKSRVSENNAIFDCKVLSRNHAIIWYSDGMFYVKDTRSSNGTFINDKRINNSEVEELHSGDIVKFGVDVIENSRKEVHGCIIACVKLYGPDGRELISTHSQSGQSTLIGGSITFDELYRLQYFMQETSQREKMLEVKLHDIQKVIELTRRNASTCWQAMIDEDRLLNRIDVLESKLKFLQKNTPDDELKDEILKLQEDKCLYQNSAKEALRKVYQERMEAVQKLTTIERALCSSEDECSLLRDQLLRTQQNLQEVSDRLTRFENECKEYRANNEKVQNEVQDIQQLQMKLKEKENELEDYKNQISELLAGKRFLQRRLEALEGNDNASDDDTISKTSDISSNRCTVKKWLENSDLNNREGSADIIKAICEDTDCDEDIDSDIDTISELEKIQNKLHEVEKKLVQFTSYLSNDESHSKVDDTSSSTATTTSSTVFPSSTTTLNDGNQNVQQSNKSNDINGILKTTTTNLMEICNEVFEYVTAINNSNRIQKDYKKLESKLQMTQAEINTLQSELANRPTFNQFQEKLNINEYLEKQLNLTYEKVNELEKEISVLKVSNECLQKKLKKFNDGDNYTKGIDIACGTADEVQKSSISNGDTINNDIVNGLDTDTSASAVASSAIINDIINNTVITSASNAKFNALSSKVSVEEHLSATSIPSLPSVTSLPPLSRSASSTSIVVVTNVTTQTANTMTSTATTTTTATDTVAVATATSTETETYPSSNHHHNSRIIDDNVDELNEKSIKNDMDLMNDKAIQYEEELIIFKEKYNKLLTENLDLKNSIIELKQDVQNIRGRYLAKLFMYGTFIIVIISYFISLYN